MKLSYRFEDALLMATRLHANQNAHFIALMDRFMPSWQHRRDQLSQLPVRHEEWEH
jgi:hypothetical protein